MTHFANQKPVGVPVPRPFVEALPGQSLLGPRVSMAQARYDVTAFTGEGALSLGLPVPNKLRQAAPRRQAEYTAGRYCARAAMSRFRDDGGQPHTVPGPSEAAPSWPSGLVGSLSHARGRAAAAVAPAEEVMGLGIDVDQIMKPEQSRRIEAEICPTEHEALPLPAAERAKHVTAIFSVKECFFKCLYPLVDRMFWFDDATVVLSRDLSGRLHRFRVSLLCDLAPFPKGWTGGGTIRCEDGYVLSAMAIRQEPEAA